MDPPFLPPLPLLPSPDPPPFLLPPLPSPLSPVVILFWFLLLVVASPRLVIVSLEELALVLLRSELALIFLRFRCGCLLCG